MTVIHFAIGTFIITGFNIGTLVGILAFLVVYQNSSGPIAYTYATETCCDIALGMCILVLYLTILLLSLTTNPLMDSALQPQGVFYMFAIFSFIATVFLYCYLGETRGLTKFEKKSLFVPGGPWGRKLKHGEQPSTPMTYMKRDKYMLQLNKTEDTRSYIENSEEVSQN